MLQGAEMHVGSDRPLWIPRFGTVGKIASIEGRKESIADLNEVVYFL